MQISPLQICKVLHNKTRMNHDSHISGCLRSLTFLVSGKVKLVQLMSRIYRPRRRTKSETATFIDDFVCVFVIGISYLSGVNQMKIRSMKSNNEMFPGIR